MIRQLEDNDAAACVALMNKSWHDNEGYSVGYDNKNEVSWILHLTKHITEAQVNPHFFTRGSWNEDGDLKGFFLASTFVNYYTSEHTMDVKDCIVDQDIGNTVFTTVRFFDEMMAHIKKNGGLYWRADSVRSLGNCEKYAQLLEKRYNATRSLSMRGRI